MLHRMFQKHNVMPHEFFALDERYKTFMYASELLILDAEIEEYERNEKQRKKGGQK